MGVTLTCEPTVAHLIGRNTFIEGVTSPTPNESQFAPKIPR
jgi:hypothetical protein